MIIGERLAELREDKKLRQKELATILGVKSRSITSYENNHSAPNDEVKLKIARYFDVSLDYLMGLTDEQSSFTRKDVFVLPKGFPEEAMSELKSFVDYLKQKYL